MAEQLKDIVEQFVSIPEEESDGSVSSESDEPHNREKTHCSEMKEKMNEVELF